MGRKVQRIVEAALIEGIGPVTAQDLVAQSNDTWGIWRDRITDRRQGSAGLDARCLACNGEVYIRTAQRRGVTLPLFAHYSGNDPNCPWHHGRNMLPDDARASQYRGRQESDFHRLMCEQVAELVALDPRHVRHKVEQYMPPTETAYGRFPDIYVEWKDFGDFVVEFQMSNTFQTEISARCNHYGREGLPLLWILFGIQTSGQVQQSFLDVIRRHRGNAFVLDYLAIAESKKQRTLVLNCHLRKGDGFDPPRLVRFDELTIPRSKLPYFEDRIVAPLLAEFNRRREPWLSDLAEWDRERPFPELDRPQSLLVAAAFSIFSTANRETKNYASLHPNIRAMLNTYLSVGTFGRYTDLLTRLIENTSTAGLLQDSVGRHLRRYRNNEQIDERSQEWSILRKLLPEALDPVFRDQLQYLDALPDWANPELPV